jgi:hypothetical protein
VTRWTEEQLSIIQGKRGRDAVTRIQSKYRNIPVAIGTDRFGSRAEARRWQDLQLMERAGEISDLKRQVRFEFHVNGQHVCDYIADATYVRAGQYTVEDTKSPSTQRNGVYRLKKKLLRALYQLEILET